MMEQREYRFDEGTPFQEFIDQYRDKIVGHTLKACYLSTYMFVKATTDEPVFFVIDDIYIGVKYFFPGHIALLIVDENNFEMTGVNKNYPEYRELQFHSETPNWKDQWLDWNTEMPAMNQKIADISIGRFSHKYEDDINSERPDGGDYFSWIRLSLEDGSEFFIQAESAASDGYVDLWRDKLPAFPLIKTELDRRPQDFVLRLGHCFDDFVRASTITPDELAEIAMYYMRKCDHEIERYKEAHGGAEHGAYTLYTDQLHDVIELFLDQGMNKDYIDRTGKSLRDLAAEIGDEAGKRVLPLIYTDSKRLGSLNWIDRNLHLVGNLLNMAEDDLEETYKNLPEEIKSTPFGKKLKELNQDGLWMMEKQIEEMISNLRLIR